MYTTKQGKGFANIYRDGRLVAQAVAQRYGTYFGFSSDNGATWWGYSFESVTLGEWVARFETVAQ